MHILTFDIEEWFHLLDNASTKTEVQWQNFEVRIHQNMERVFKILEATDVKASFFVLGWIAEKYPEVVKEISDRGYEIGSHTTSHQLVYEQSQQAFQADVERSIKSLEDISGKKVNMFRAPGFSITEKNKWSFEILYELGIEIDCSVFPAGRAHGGLPSYGVAEPSILKYEGVQLKEFPINTFPILNRPMIFSGCGYFRFYHYQFIKEWTQKSDYVMYYFNTMDFDPDQPIVKGLSMQRKFKSYVGLKKADDKLKKWISDFEFIDIETANKQIDWNTVKTIQL